MAGLRRLELPRLPRGYAFLLLRVEIAGELRVDPRLFVLLLYFVAAPAAAPPVFPLPAAGPAAVLLGAAIVQSSLDRTGSILTIQLFRTSYLLSAIPLETSVAILTRDFRSLFEVFPVARLCRTSRQFGNFQLQSQCKGMRACASKLWSVATLS